MADIFLDAFTGAGTLATHAADTGQTYADFYAPSGYTAAAFALSGGFAVTQAPNHLAGVKIVAPPVVPGTFSLEIIASVGTISPSGYVTLNLDFSVATISFQVDNTTFYLPLDGATLYPPYSAGSHTFRLDVTPTLRTWFVDGVSVGSHATAVSLAGTFLDFSLDNSVGASDAQFKIDSMRIFTGAPPPAFWTTLRGATETP